MESCPATALPTLPELYQQQRCDPDLSFWFAWISDQTKPTKQSLDSELFQWWQRDQDRIMLNGDDILIRVAHLQTTARSQIIRQFIIPHNCIRQVLYWFHDRTSHFGFDRCYSKMRMTCYWLKMERDMKHYISA